MESESWWNHSISQLLFATHEKDQNQMELKWNQKAGGIIQFLNCYK